MKRNTKPINKEIPYPDGKIIVSKTDLKGRITYCNELFTKMSGYKEEQLIGAPHNIVRHPDMPRIIFKLLWETIQGGHEIDAYVKNMSKNGEYYWVIANVTPSFNVRGDVIGYFSVRRKPTQAQLAIIEPLYRDLLMLEKQGGMDASYKKIEEILKQKEMSYEEFILSF